MSRIPKVDPKMIPPKGKKNTRNAQGASAVPLAAATAAEASKYAMYGNVGAHQVLPFAVEDGGAVTDMRQCSKFWPKFFHKCKAACNNQLSGLDCERQTWSAQGFSNFFFQSISVAHYRGLAHLFRTAGDTIRCHYQTD